MEIKTQKHIMNITPEMMLEFIKIYYAPDFLPCDLGAEEMFEAEFYLNLAEYQNESNP